MRRIPDGDWTCLGCGAGIQSSDRVLFNILVTRHMNECTAPLPHEEDEDGES